MFVETADIKLISSIPVELSRAIDIAALCNLIQKSPQQVTTELEKIKDAKKRRSKLTQLSREINNALALQEAPEGTFLI